MFFCAGLDELIQQKICEQFSILETNVIWLPSRKNSDPAWIMNPNHTCQYVLVLHLQLLVNFSKMILLSPAFCMETAVGKRSFAFIVKKKAIKRRKIGRNPDAKQRKNARPNTARAIVAKVNESGLGHRQPRNKNLAR